MPFEETCLCACTHVHTGTHPLCFGAQMVNSLSSQKWGQRHFLLNWQGPCGAKLTSPVLSVGRKHNMPLIGWWKWIKALGDCTSEAEAYGFHLCASPPATFSARSAVLLLNDQAPWGQARRKKNDWCSLSQTKKGNHTRSTSMLELYCVWWLRRGLEEFAVPMPSWVKSETWFAVSHTEGTLVSLRAMQQHSCFLWIWCTRLCHSDPPKSSNIEINKSWAHWESTSQWQQSQMCASGQLKSPGKEMQGVHKWSHECLVMQPLRTSSSHSN